MYKSFLLSIVIFLLSQHDSLAQTFIQSNSLQLNANEDREIHKSLKDFKVIYVNTKALSTLCHANENGFDFQLKIESHNWNITLEKNELRAPNYRADENDMEMNLPFSHCITYKGYLDNNTTQVVRLAIAEGLLEGYVIEDGKMILIKALSKFVLNYPSKDHFVVFNLDDIIDDPTVRTCGTQEAKSIKNTIEKAKSLSTARATTSCRVLEIATEADFEFFQANSSDVTTANNNILGILNQVEGVYQTTFNIQFLIPYQSVWSTISDPYSAVATQVSGTNVVNELANFWQANRSSVSRDVVHFFSAKTGHGVKGSARILAGVVCDNIANSYAFTATVGPHDLVITTAHEIGHLFSATHPDPSGASCSPTKTIMCIDPNNLGRVLQFATFSQDEINTWINGHNACLTDVLNVNISGTEPVCSTGQFTVVGLPPNSSTTSWSSANTSALTVTNGGVPTRVNNFSGSVDVTANGNYGNAGCTFTSTKAIWVGSPSEVNLYASPSSADGNTLCAQNSVTIHTTTQYPFPNSLSYQWTINNGTLLLDGGSYGYASVLTPSAYQTMSVSLISDNGCGIVNSYREWSISNMLDGISCQPYYEESIFPNPTDDQVTVRFATSKGNKKVTIYNYQQHKVVDCSVTDQGELSLSLRNLPDGLYTVQIEEQNRVTRNRLVIRKN